MKEIIEIIKKHDNIVMFIILLIITTTFSHYLTLEANDELWNFSNIYKMYNGYEIYKDLNVIITPFYFYIGLLMFKILAPNYYVYRILQTIVVYMILFFSMYIIFKKLEIKKLNSMLYTSIVGSMFCICFIDGSYNMLAIGIVLVGIIVQISNKKNANILNIIQGIVMFLVYMTKQNIGAFYIAGILLYNITSNKQNKDKLKAIFIQLLTSGILLFIYLLYLYNAGNLYNFVNYTILGIGEFSNNNIKFDYRAIIIITEIIIAILFLFIAIKKKIKFKEEELENIKLLASISITMNLIAYPLANFAHILIASSIFIILFIYIIYISMLKELLSDKKYEKIRICILSIIIVVFLCINIIQSRKYYTEINSEEYYFTKTSPYYGSIATKETIDDINNICNYIKQQNEEEYDVKIVSYYSNLYMNIFNKNNGKFDLPFYGNLGQAGEEGVIEELKQLTNTKILILKERDNIYQEAQKVMDYVEENMTYEGEISRFSIYKTI